MFDISFMTNAKLDTYNLGNHSFIPYLPSLLLTHCRCHLTTTVNLREARLR